jgi:hypothetical protein
VMTLADGTSRQADAGAASITSCAVGAGAAPAAGIASEAASRTAQAALRWDVRIIAE